MLLGILKGKMLVASLQPAPTSTHRPFKSLESILVAIRGIRLDVSLDLFKRDGGWWYQQSDNDVHECCSRLPWSCAYTARHSLARKVKRAHCDGGSSCNPRKLDQNFRLGYASSREGKSQLWKPLFPFGLDTRSTFGVSGRT